MGDGFEVFFVEMDRIKGLCGGNDRELEAAIVEKQGYEDHLLALDPPVYGDEAQRWRRALRGIIAGETSDRALAETYGRVLETICAFVAHDVESVVACPFRMNYIEEMDKAFDAAMFPASIRWFKLLLGGSPIPIPWAEYPGIGSWSLAEMREALPTFRTYEPPRELFDRDEEGWTALLEILERGVSTGRDALGFYG